MDIQGGSINGRKRGPHVVNRANLTVSAPSVQSFWLSKLLMTTSLF